MGYTVATPIRDEESKARMLAFLEKNFRHWQDVCGGREGTQRFYRGPLPDGELSYDKGPCRIGFDFNAGDYEREYIFAVCRWMALKVGRVDVVETSCCRLKYPVIVYDGDDGQTEEDGTRPPAWPVIRVEPNDGDLPEEHAWCAVDRWGCRDFSVKSLPERVRRRERMLVQDYGYDGWAVVRREMQRLDALWIGDAEPCDECSGTRWPDEDHEEHCSLFEENGQK